MTYSTFGATTFPADVVQTVRIAKVAFEQDQVIIQLTDQRAIHLSLSHYAWLQWLRHATTEQRKHWEIVPSGGVVGGIRRGH